MTDHDQAAIDAMHAADAAWVRDPGPERGGSRGTVPERQLRVLLAAARPHLEAAQREREARLDHCGGCAHRYGTCGCACCAHVARAVAAERERCAALAEEHELTTILPGGIFGTGRKVPFADLLREAP